MLEVYRKFVEEFLAIPLIGGRKSAAERFPGADETYTIEGLMGDGRALQCGTSHFLGQNFAQGVRNPLSRRAERDAARVADELGRFDAAARRDDHGRTATTRACDCRRRSPRRRW